MRILDNIRIPLPSQYVSKLFSRYTTSTIAAYHVKKPFYHGVLVFIGFAMLEPSHSSQRSRIHNRPEKIEIEIRGQLENRPESPSNPVFNPVVAKVAKIDFWRRFGAKTVPEWSLRASGWDPRVPQKSTWYTFLQ